MPRPRPISANPRLSKLITQLGGTSAVARALGISAPTVSKWTQVGRDSTEPDGLPRMKHFLGLLAMTKGKVSADWLIKGRNKRTDQ